LNNATKYVASTTLRAVEWQNSILLRGDVGAEIARLKEQPGPEIQVHGSGNLIQTLGTCADWRRLCGLKVDVSPRSSAKQRAVLVWSP
jgi:dihydrofolate reductase